MYCISYSETRPPVDYYSAAPLRLDRYLYVNGIYMRYNTCAYVSTRLVAQPFYVHYIIMLHALLERGAFVPGRIRSARY